MKIGRKKWYTAKRRIKEQKLGGKTPTTQMEEEENEKLEEEMHQAEEKEDIKEDSKDEIYVEIEKEATEEERREEKRKAQRKVSDEWWKGARLKESGANPHQTPNSKQPNLLRKKKTDMKKRKKKESVERKIK